MKQFADLYERLDRTTATSEKRRAIVDYLRLAPADDAIWAIWLLAGGKISGAKTKIANTRELREWIAETSHTPLWLVEQSYEQVGDLAETLALLLDDPEQQAEDIPLSAWIEKRLLQIANREPHIRRQVIVDAWLSLPFTQRLVFNKLLTGSLRVGVSTGLVQQALAESSGVEIALIAQRMLGAWMPTCDFYQRLLSKEPQPGDETSPYPFFLASALENDVEALGAIDAWQLEWKWDGIRVQLIKRGQHNALWSRGEERLDGRFPEIEASLLAFDEDVVIDGELLAWGDTMPMPFTALQKRIQRRKPSAKMMAEVPVIVLAYDLLEEGGEDLRAKPLQWRRQRLQQLVERHPGQTIQLSPALEFRDWDSARQARDEARSRGVEGLMLKKSSSVYQVGRKRGDWWKWKVDPLTIDAVLIYAQAGHGRRSMLYTDYTFAVWDGDALVPVAKAYSGLNDAEILKLDRWIRANTLERFGPVRSVKAQHVFELGFEAVNQSSRHKSGIAVRFPRILRWRHDKSVEDADRLETLRALAEG